MGLSDRPLWWFESRGAADSPTPALAAISSKYDAVTGWPGGRSPDRASRPKSVHDMSPEQDAAVVAALFVAPVRTRHAEASVGRLLEASEG
jgi:hypothetical protein